LKIVVFFIFISTQGLFAQTANDSTARYHELTIYVVQSVSPIDFTNPSILLKTTTSCYFNAAIKKNYYVIGHTLVRINSTLLPAPRYAAMVGASQSDKVKMVMNKKLGFGSLGYTIPGRLEKEKSITRGIRFYAKHKRVAYIKFIVNEESAKRILQYIDHFDQKSDLGFAPSEHYNGALWPRYEYEGAGCSSFGMALLDAVNILPAESKNWIIDINIPIELVGGEFNNNKKIKSSTISRTKSWYTGTGTEGVDYVNYKVYDPSLIFDWIINKRNQNDSLFIAENEDGIPGLTIKMQNMVYDENDLVIKQRTDTTSLFVKYYYKKLREQVPEK